MNKDGDIVIPIGLNCNTCTQNTTADGIKFGTIYKLNPKTGTFTLIADGGCDGGPLACYYLSMATQFASNITSQLSCGCTARSGNCAPVSPVSSRQHEPYDPMAVEQMLL